MQRPDHADLIGGILLVVIGGAIAIFSATSYSVGTLQRMGPGLFPSVLGVVLAIFGAIIALRSPRAAGDPLDIRIVTPICVILSIVAFALIMPRFGLIPAIFAITIISAIAELKFQPVRILLLATALSVLAISIFVLGLGLQLPMIRMSF